MSTLKQTLSIFFVTTALAACGSSLGDDSGPHDMQHPDQAVLMPDMTACNPGIFSGFPGTVAVERRLDCPCGCLIDSLEQAATSSLWTRTTVGSTLANSATGLVVDVDGAQSGASATLSSVGQGGPFYIENDFDLRLDYTLDAMVAGGSDELRIELADNVFYVITRTRTAGGMDQYTTTLNTTPVTASTTAATGTLRLLRRGAQLTAFGDSNQISQISTAESTRVSIMVGSSVSACVATQADGGAGDGGDGCTMSSTLSNLRLLDGALVDRLN
jgi:hypothetical protein